MPVGGEAWVSGARRVHPSFADHPDRRISGEDPVFQKLGPWMHDKRRWVLGFWVLALVGFSMLSGAVGNGFKDDFNLPDVESKLGFDVLEDNFGGTGAGQTGTIVFK